MSKENQWIVTVNGKAHTVHCVVHKSLYDVFVDGDLAVKVPRQHLNTEENSEYNIPIGGKTCQFVVYDGVPDVVVDGILVGEERKLQKQERRNKILKIFGGVLLICVCTYAAFLWYVFEAAGEPIFGGIFGLLGILVFLLMGVGLLISAVRKKKEY